MPNPDAGGRVMKYEEIWRDLNVGGGGGGDDSSESTGTGGRSWILESVDGDDGLAKAQKGMLKTFYARSGSHFLALRQTVLPGGGVAFLALRQDFSLATRRWETRYEIGGDLSALWRMDGSWDENVAGGWGVGDTVVVRRGEECVVRAFE